MGRLYSSSACRAGPNRWSVSRHIRWHPVRRELRIPRPLIFAQQRDDRRRSSCTLIQYHTRIIHISPDMKAKREQLDRRLPMKSYTQLAMANILFVDVYWLSQDNQLQGFQLTSLIQSTPSTDHICILSKTQKPDLALIWMTCCTLHLNLSKISCLLTLSRSKCNRS